MKSAVLAAAAAVMVTALPVVARDATPAELAAVRKGMEGSLKDPESVQFREVKVGRKPGEPVDYVCGKMNAKNGFGAYTGFRRFLAILIPPEPGSTPLSMPLDLDDALGYATKECGAAGLL